MHQKIFPDDLPDAETTALRQRLRHALARDLNLPERDPAVSATMKTFSVAAAATPDAAGATLDTWWCIVAHTHALVSR